MEYLLKGNEIIYQLKNRTELKNILENSLKMPGGHGPYYLGKSVGEENGNVIIERYFCFRGTVELHPTDVIKVRL